MNRSIAFMGGNDPVNLKIKVDKSAQRTLGFGFRGSPASAGRIKRLRVTTPHARYRLLLDIYWLSLSRASGHGQLL